MTNTGMLLYTPKCQNPERVPLQVQREFSRYRSAGVGGCGGVRHADEATWTLLESKTQNLDFTVCKPIKFFSRFWRNSYFNVLFQEGGLSEIRGPRQGQNRKSGPRFHRVTTAKEKSHYTLKMTARRYNNGEELQTSKKDSKRGRNID